MRDPAVWCKPCVGRGCKDGTACKTQLRVANWCRTQLRGTNSVRPGYKPLTGREQGAIPYCGVRTKCEAGLRFMKCVRGPALGHELLARPSLGPQIVSKEQTACGTRLQVTN